MADEKTYEVGSTLEPLAIRPYNDVWYNIFGKYNTLVNNSLKMYNNNMAAARKKKIFLINEDLILQPHACETNTLPLFFYYTDFFYSFSYLVHT
jgi:hypothetical protein